jgi:hypothetical protein
MFSGVDTVLLVCVTIVLRGCLNSSQEFRGPVYVKCTSALPTRVCVWTPRLRVKQANGVRVTHCTTKQEC